jgi:hypothetical protein
MSRPSEVGSRFNKKTFNKKRFNRKTFHYYAVVPKRPSHSGAEQDIRNGSSPVCIQAWVLKKLIFKRDAPQGKPSAGAHIA